MAIGGGMSCVKYLLFCFNLLFAITGLVVVSLGIKEQFETHSYINVSDFNFFSTGPITLIIVGLIIFVVAFFGCCGAVKENHCMIVTFSVFLLIIFVAEIAVGIAGYIHHDTLEESVHRYLNHSIIDYPNNTEVRNNYDFIQTDLQCCGINGPQDWANNNIKIPNSCCSGQEIINGALVDCNASSPMLHQTGCLQLLVDHYKDIAVILGGVGLGVAIVQLLGVIFACCLARSIRREYETV